jgi:hypothetical protein
VVSCHLVTKGASVRSHGSPCGTCGGQSGTGTGFSSSTLVFPCPYHPSNVSSFNVSSGGWATGPKCSRSSTERVLPHRTIQYNTTWYNAIAIQFIERWFDFWCCVWVWIRVCKKLRVQVSLRITFLWLLNNFLGVLHLFYFFNFSYSILFRSTLHTTAVSNQISSVFCRYQR